MKFESGSLTTLNFRRNPQCRLCRIFPECKLRLGSGPVNRLKLQIDIVLLAEDLFAFALTHCLPLKYFYSEIFVLLTLSLNLAATSVTAFNILPAAQGHAESSVIAGLPTKTAGSWSFVKQSSRWNPSSILVLLLKMRSAERPQTGPNFFQSSRRRPKEPRRLASSGQASRPAGSPMVGLPVNSTTRWSNVL